MKITNVQQAPGLPLCWGNAWASLPSRVLYNLRGWECWNFSLDCDCPELRAELQISHSLTPNADLWSELWQCTAAPTQILQHAEALSCAVESPAPFWATPVMYSISDNAAPKKRKEKESMEVNYAAPIWIKKQYFTEYQWKKSIKLHEIRDQNPLSLN